MKVQINKNMLLCKDNIINVMNLIKKLTKIIKSLIFLLEDIIEYLLPLNILYFEAFTTEHFFSKYKNNKTSYLIFTRT